MRGEEDDYVLKNPVRTLKKSGVEHIFHPYFDTAEYAADKLQSGDIRLGIPEHSPLLLRKGRCVAAGYPPAYPLRVKKGGEGGFKRRADIKIPLDPPFTKGEGR